MADSFFEYVDDRLRQEAEDRALAERHGDKRQTDETLRQIERAGKEQTK